MEAPRVVIVGAGVTGLTTALLLSRQSQYAITVIAKHMPGDYDSEYASPWAGANYLPISEIGSRAATWDEDTWPELERLAREQPEAGVHFQETRRYVRQKDMSAVDGSRTRDCLRGETWYKHIMPNYRQLRPEELPQGCTSGHTFTSVSGVQFYRASLHHIKEAKTMHMSKKPASVIVNCTGISAASLGGVDDDDMISVRGQTVLVRNQCTEMCDVSGTDEGDEEVCYVMQRAAGGGTLLGGSYQKGNSDSQIDPNLAIRIMTRCVQICPSLTDGKGIEHLDIIRHGVGFRPVRKGGTRLEKESTEDGWIVHNYGHGGYGYQSSYGCAQEAVNLIGEAVNNLQ